MSPAAVATPVPNGDTFDDGLDLAVVGLGVQYPDYHNGPEALEQLAARHYPSSNVMTKVLSINRFTGIEKRAAIGDAEHPLVNKATPPSIRELNDLFMNDGVRMAVGAAGKAMAEWGGMKEDITHMVSTTCTNSANPGFDHFVAKQLGLPKTVEKILLHGVGCSGGLAALRTACNLALGMTARRLPARILVLACEVSSVFVRSELESIHQDQEVRIGVCLFSDCASACLVSNGIGELEGETPNEPVYDILGWQHELIDDTAHDLGFDVDPLGWKVVLTPRVPNLTCKATPAAFDSLISSLPSLQDSSPKRPGAGDFLWALHPGGSTILTGVQGAMGLSENHLLASFQTYVEHGNSSSATILSVLDRLRRNAAAGEGLLESKAVLDGRGVVSAAFGPGICLEMMMLRRADTRPPPAATSNGHAHESGAANGNGNTNGSHETTTTQTKNGVHADTATNGAAAAVSNGNGAAHDNLAPAALTNGYAAVSVPVDLAEGVVRLEAEDVD